MLIRMDNPRDIILCDEYHKTNTFVRFAWDVIGMSVSYCENNSVLTNNISILVFKIIV